MHLAPIIQDLAIILGVAALITFIFRRIRQPVVLGYIIAGIIVGPHTPSIISVTDVPNINVWAELGVIFLMFALGLEFSFRKLARVGFAASVTAVIQIVVMMTLGFWVGKFLNWPTMDSIFLSCIVAISSTTIIIKALEELGLKSRRFAEMVFGMLIVEDLAAILMLVALSSLATQSTLQSSEVFQMGGKLILVVGSWFLAGMVLVPRFVKSVSRHGNNEMLTVLSAGLCLLLVTASVHFQFSAALGAFIMGSIIAESTEAKRIEELIQPLRDIFGAVFFVSVGMLLDPQPILENLGTLGLLVAIIIIGKVASVTLGAIAAGQTIPTSMQAGLSMAQIGEFSFIIATLGQNYNVIDKKLYPIVVAASLVTTFTTPYLVKISGDVARSTEAKLPRKIKLALDKYVTFTQRRRGNVEARTQFFNRVTRFIGHGIAVSAIFLLSANFALPMLLNKMEVPEIAVGLSWFVTFAVCAPFIWAMFNCFNETKAASPGRQTPPLGIGMLVSRVATIVVVGLLSNSFFPFWISVVVIVASTGLLIFLFRSKIELYSHWFEEQFASGFQQDSPGTSQSTTSDLSYLAPWEAHLVEIELHPNSSLIGKPLSSLGLREKFGINIVVIRRGEDVIVAPTANEILYPADQILCFGTDEEINSLRSAAESPDKLQPHSSDLSSYTLRQFPVRADSQLNYKSIKNSGIREKFNCIVVGVERKETRISNPHSEFVMQEEDVVWVVGESIRIEALLRF